MDVKAYLPVQLSTTTVVMKAHESVDESVAGAHVVGNGFDGPRAASSCETSTKPSAVGRMHG